MNLGIQETRRLEDQQHRELDRGVELVGVGELRIDEELPLFVGQRAAKRPFGEAAAVLLHAVAAIGGVGSGVRKIVDVGDDVVGDFDRGRGRRLVPGLRDRRAARVARAAVVGREGGGYDERSRHAARGEVPRGNHLPHAAWRLPAEHDRRRLVLELEELDADRVRTPAEEPQRLDGFADLAGADPFVDQGLVGIVDPEADAVFGFDRELVVAGFIDQERAVPAHRELFGLDFFGLWAAVVEVEVDLGVDAVKDAFVAASVARFVVVAFEAALVAERLARRRKSPAGRR